jgi:hypothetical protein
VRIERGYVKAFAWAEKHRDARMLEKLVAGLNSHRRYMEERVG